MISNLPSRLDWPTGFPRVVVHTDLQSRDQHRLYEPAKSGSAEAALSLATRLLNRQAIADIRKLIAGRNVLILPVVADEAMGFNAIPDGMAHVLGRELQQDVVAGGIVQSNKVGHTRAKAFQRIVTPAEFKGDVQEGANYLLVDDHVGLGGTLANLRGHIEVNGGNVIGMTTLTKSQGAEQISLTTETRDALWTLHGQTLNTLWQSAFGHGLNSLTELEGLVLCRQPTIGAIANFLAQASIEASSRGMGKSKIES